MAMSVNNVGVFSGDISCKTICVYGGSGTGKSSFAKTILNDNFANNTFTECHCWAPEVSISNNSYKMIFGEHGCYHEFEKFQEWYVDLTWQLTAEIIKRDLILQTPSIFLSLLSLLPENILEEIIEITSAIASQSKQSQDCDQLISLMQQVGIPAIKDNRQKIRYKHGTCSVKNCAICYYVGIRRPLILIDDFGMNKELVMTYPFSMAPTLSRHLSLTIMVLSQVYELVKNSFKINTQILVFTSRVALSEMLTHPKTSMSPQQKLKLISLFDKLKEQNKWCNFIIDQGSGGMDIMQIIPRVKNFTNLYKFGIFT